VEKERAKDRWGNKGSWGNKGAEKEQNKEQKKETPKEAKGERRGKGKANPSKVSALSAESTDTEPMNAQRNRAIG
jgi:hypothetical protein